MLLEWAQHRPPTPRGAAELLCFPPSTFLALLCCKANRPAEQEQPPSRTPCRFSDPPPPSAVLAGAGTWRLPQEIRLKLPQTILACKGRPESSVSLCTGALLSATALVYHLWDCTQGKERFPPAPPRAELTKQQRSWDPDSWVWRCPRQSACSPPYL